MNNIEKIGFYKNDELEQKLGLEEDKKKLIAFLKKKEMSKIENPALKEDLAVLNTSAHLQSSLENKTAYPSINLSHLTQQVAAIVARNIQPKKKDKKKKDLTKDIADLQAVIYNKVLAEGTQQYSKKAENFKTKLQRILKTDGIKGLKDFFRGCESLEDAFKEKGKLTAEVDLRLIRHWLKDESLSDRELIDVEEASALKLALENDVSNLKEFFKKKRAKSDLQEDIAGLMAMFNLKNSSVNISKYPENLKALIEVPNEIVPAKSTDFLDELTGQQDYLIAERKPQAQRNGLEQKDLLETTTEIFKVKLEDAPFQQAVLENKDLIKMEEIDYSERFLDFDKLKEHLEKKIIPILREGQVKLNTNCAFLAESLINYFQTGQEPFEAVPNRASCEKHFSTFVTYKKVPIKVKEEDTGEVLPAKNKRTKKSATKKTVPKVKTIEKIITSVVDTTTSFGSKAPPQIIYPEKNGEINIEQGITIDLTRYEQKSCNWVHLKSCLLAEAAGQAHSPSIGVIVSGGVGKFSRAMGHMIVYCATPRNVLFIDAQGYDPKFGEGSPCSYNIEDLYDFYDASTNQEISRHLASDLVFRVPMGSFPLDASMNHFFIPDSPSSNFVQQAPQQPLELTQELEIAALPSQVSNEVILKTAYSLNEKNKNLVSQSLFRPIIGRQDKDEKKPTKKFKIK